MFDFGHEKRVARKFAQLDALNGDINSQTITLNDLQNKIATICAKYPDLTEYDAMNMYFRQLQIQISDREQELADVRKELEIERTKLDVLKEITYETGKVLIVEYEPTEDRSKSYLNAFRLKSQEKMKIDRQTYFFSLYESIDKDRRIAINNDGLRFTGFKEDTLEPLNAIPIKCLTLPEAQSQMGTSFPLTDRITRQELEEFLNAYREYHRGKLEEAKASSPLMRIRRSLFPDNKKTPEN